MNSNLAVIVSQVFFILVLYFSACSLKEKFKTKYGFEKDFDFLYLFPALVTALFMSSYLMQETLADQLGVFRGWFSFIIIVAIPLVLIYFISFVKTATKYIELLSPDNRKKEELIYENQNNTNPRKFR